MKKLIHSPWARGGFCGLMIFAIICGLVLPGLRLQAADPENPLVDQNVEDITVLEMGENLSALTSIATPDGLGDKWADYMLESLGSKEDSAEDEQEEQQPEAEDPEDPEEPEADEPEEKQEEEQKEEDQKDDPDEEEPEDPDDPEDLEPEDPDNPEDPEPEDPDDKEDPEPEDPDDKEDPEPEDPDDPEDLEPENPDDKEDPEPEDPDNPEDLEPENPDDKEDPEPEDPDNPEDPEPEDPDQPGDPDPDKPGGDGEDPDQPGGEGGASGGPGDGDNPGGEPGDGEDPDQPSDGENPAPGPGDGGQEGGGEGGEGGEGGDKIDPDIAMVMTWYKYGSQEKTIVCNPLDTVSKTINIAQLPDNVLQYKFDLTGDNADQVTITEVAVAEGDGMYQTTNAEGTLTVSLPDRNTYRNYTFRVRALLDTVDESGSPTQEALTFTYVIRCEDAIDLELELRWEKANGSSGTITCAADKTVSRTIESNELNNQVFAYTPRLTGNLAQSAQLISGSYTTASGGSGDLQMSGGSIILQPAADSDEETYYLTLNAKVQMVDEDGDPITQTVSYHITLTYRQVLDVQLSFVWLQKGTTRKTLVCEPNERVSLNVKNNQLSAGALKYEMSLTGESAENGRILSAVYETDAGESGTLEDPASGSLALHMPEDRTAVTYTITVKALVNGEQMNFTVRVRYTNDVTLQMQYTVLEDGSEARRQVTCENGKSKTAETVYDDQLTENQLSYQMTLTGEDTDGMTITGVTCYQSGSGRTLTLQPSDTVKLLLKDGSVGENTFRVTAEDSAGEAYTFSINVPYKHQGKDTVKIRTNLTDGMTVTNETKLNMSVEAWSEDEDGNRISTILASGTQTKLIVTLDGETVSVVSSSSTAQEYDLYPKNPEVGDTNTHTIVITAEDAYGNRGELTLTLNGQRNQAGQKKGTATLYIDMTSIGLGVEGPISYDVLADEPISYVVAKAIWGYDAGEPFGTAKETFGWSSGKYSGTLDQGFYLQSLSPGGSVNAKALTGSSWNKYGSNEADVLQAIDDQLGTGTGLATLWRCIYRNGLNKSSGSDQSIGEHDYSQGSGWLYSLNGSYYPGQSMSEYYLQDGDVLTLRYTLAYGWDVDGGTKGYGDAVGYCVTALNGSYSINHRMEEVVNEDGSISNVCHCCGLVEACAHQNTVWKDLDDGTHILYCEDCKTTVGDAEDHIWEHQDDCHVCEKCGLEESHNWKEVEGSNTATCTEAGTRTMRCTICGMEQEQESPAQGHKLGNAWHHDVDGHYQKCDVCGEIIQESRGTHQYQYDAEWDDWFCTVCGAGHDWDYCGNDALEITSATCQRIDYHCSACGVDLHREGTFDEYHAYADGICGICGASDPNYVPPEPEQPEEPKDPEEPEASGES